MIGNLYCVGLLHDDSQAQSDALPPIEASALEHHNPFSSLDSFCCRLCLLAFLAASAAERNGESACADVC